MLSHRCVSQTVLCVICNYVRSCDSKRVTVLSRRTSWCDALPYGHTTRSAAAVLVRTGAHGRR